MSARKSRRLHVEDIFLLILIEDVFLSMWGDHFLRIGDHFFSMWKTIFSLWGPFWVCPPYAKMFLCVYEHVVIYQNICNCGIIIIALVNIIWYGNSLFDTTYKYTHLNILHN